ncbi:uncharacterized protein [Amphiura filiformis]|uniref:uncharacterized protein n=1 Tax=Amphiura filiformis TaxID=82378 RepID=UPI003B2239A0
MTTRNEKGSELPYLNIEYGDGFLFGPDEIISFGGMNRYDLVYQKEVWVASYIRTGERLMRPSNKSTDETNGPGGRKGHTFTRIGNKALLFGGIQRLPQPSHHVFAEETPAHPDLAYLLDLETLVWSKPTITGDVPDARAYHTTQHVGGKIYIIGGIGMIDPKQPIKYPPSYSITYNLTTNTMHSTKLNLPQALHLSRHSCTLLNNTLILCGGFNADNTINSKTYLIPVDDVANMKTLHTGNSNMNHVALVHNSKIYTLGGLKNTQVWEFSGPEAGDDGFVVDDVEDQDGIAGEGEDGDLRGAVGEDAGASDDESEDEEGEEDDVTDEEEEEELFMEDANIEAADDNCAVGAACSNLAADASISNKFIQCDQCNLYYHFSCQGFNSNPFKDEDEQLDSTFYCVTCRENIRSARRRALLSETNGIVISRY